MAMMAVSRRVQRQRQDSYRSSESLTPADDLSSWLGDDLCTNCGAPARANLLYCSQQCKDEDAQDGRKSRTSTSAPTFTPYNYPVKDSQSWRYPCPPSPNLTAKYNSSLTSPALAALENPSSSSSSSSRSRGKGEAILDHDEVSMSSSDDGSSAAMEKQDKNRRSSSQSTFSTASDVPSTDCSTPLSAALALYDDVEDDDEVELTKLVLPPSVHPAASILLNSASREARNATATSSNITPDGLKRSSPLQQSSLATSNQAGTIATTSSNGANKADSKGKTLDFARRPSSTNLPAPVLFTSPTITKAGSTRQESSRRKSSNAISIKVVARKEATQKDNFTRVNETNSSTVSAPTESPISGDQLRGSIDSPPGIPSVSSSAGRTLRGISPPHSMSPGYGACQGAVCGRFGCHGLGSSEECVAEAVEKESSSPRRPLLNRTHKHTHSAAAGLNYLAQGGSKSDSDNQNNSLAARSKLLMTPVMGSNATFENNHASKSKESTFFTTEQAEVLKSPPRGRSKARGGRRSSSRRSPSPPRGVARRGHSQDFNTISRDGGQDSLTCSPISARSNPIAIGLDQISPSEEKRGRSPTEKGSSGNRNRDKVCNDVVTSATVARHSCEMAWPAYGHDVDVIGDQDENEEEQRAKLAKKAAKAVLHGGHGYDDVDLDEL